MIKLINIFLFTILAIQCSIGQTMVENGTAVKESIYIYTDRDVYLPGEIVWFSADYLIDGQKEVDLSKVLYAELLSFDGTSLARNKFKISESRVEGKLEIPLGLESNYYLLTAYTQYQRNNEPEDIFSQVLTIINPAIPLAKVNIDDSWLIKTVPMGSSASLQNANEFALQVNPLLVDKLKNAQVVDTAGNTISEIKFFKNGLGHFDLVPEFNSSYLVRSVFRNGDTVLTPIKTENLDNKIETYKELDNLVVVINIPKNVDQSEYSLLVYSQSKKLIYSAKINGQQQKGEVQVPLEKLSEGLNFLLLKSKDGKLIESKAIFEFPDKPIGIDISTEKKSYKQRESVVLNIHPSAKSIARSGTFSLSVVKSGAQFDNINLPAYLLENPVLISSFFQSHPITSRSIEKQVNVLLAIYNQQLNQKQLDYFTKKNTQTSWIPETRGASLSGVVINRETRDPLPGIEILVSILGENPQLKIFTTDEEGEFLFALDHIQNQTNIYLTIRNELADAMEILVNGDFSESMPDLTNTGLIMDTAFKDFIEEMYVSAQVTELHGEEDSITSVGSKAIRFSEPDVSIVLDDYVAMPDLEAVLNELVPFVKVKKKGDAYSLEILDEKTNLSYGDPLILVDDLPVFNVNEVLKLQTGIILEIHVMNSTYVYGDHIVKGIVMITTKTNNFGNIKLPQSFTSLEFLAPAAFGKSVFSNYAKDESKTNRKPDFRNTLYYTNNLVLSAEKSKVNFFTSDNVTSYDVILRGINESGKQIYGHTSFKVSK